QSRRRRSAFPGAHTRSISGPDSPKSWSRSDDDGDAGSAERSHYRGRPGLPTPVAGPQVGGQGAVTVRQQQPAARP
ncbi:unnamed protein product, partial [Ixodes hexagonus]